MELLIELNTAEKNYGFWNLIISLIELLIIGISLVVAWRTYTNNRKKDIETKAIDCLSFFREQIMTKAEAYLSEIMEDKGKEFKIENLKLDNLNLKDYEKDQQKAILQQMELSNNDRIISSFYILNMLEEVSLKITYFNLQDSKILTSIRKSFIHIIEMHGYHLLLARNFSEVDEIYSNILKLYRLWKDKVDRRSYEEIREDFEKMINSK